MRYDLESLFLRKLNKKENGENVINGPKMYVLF